MILLMGRVRTSFFLDNQGEEVILGKDRPKKQKNKKRKILHLTLTGMEGGEKQSIERVEG